MPSDSESDVRPREEPRIAAVWPWFFSLMAFAVTAGGLAHMRLPFAVEATEYGTAAMEFYRTHHISSDFVSVGYGALLGVGMVLFHGARGAAYANLATYFAYVAVVWVALREMGATARQAFWTGVLFALYPDVLLSVNKLYHSILSPLLLVMYVAAALALVVRRNYWTDLVMALVLGVALACRSNVILLFPATLFLMWKYRLPHVWLRAAAQFAGAGALFALIVVAVHGSIFWPRVGVYNLFAGWNEFTAQELWHHYETAGESSIIPALKLRGIDADQDWGRPDNIPGDKDIRNAQFTPIYSREAIRFMREHPASLVTLTAEKTVTLFRPDLLVHPASTPAGWMKIAVAFSFPLWVALCVFLPHARNDPARWVFGLTLASYIVPLLASTTAPLLRGVVDVVSLLGSAGMLIEWGRRKKSGTRAT